MDVFTRGDSQRRMTSRGVNESKPSILVSNGRLPCPTNSSDGSVDSLDMLSVKLETVEKR